MSVEKLAQNSFVSGQYDRSVQHNEKTALVGTGFSKGLNVLSGEKGELRKRLGTKLLKELNGASVVVPFRHEERDLLLVFGKNTLEYYDYDKGELVKYGANVDTQNTLAWTSNTTSGYTISTNYGTYSNLYKVFTATPDMQAITMSTYFDWTGGNTNWATTHRDDYDITLELPEAGVVGKFYIQFKSQYTKEAGYNGWLDGIIQYSDNGEDWYIAKSYLSSEAGVNAYKYLHKTTFGGVTYHQYFIGFNLILSQDVGKHKFWRIVFKDLDYCNVSGSENLLCVRFYERTKGQDIDFVSTDISDLKSIKYTQNKNIMKITDGQHMPKSILHSGKLEYSDFVPTSSSTIWGTNGFPASVCYFQNRLWFGGFEAFPNRVLASKFNDENNFTLSATAQYDDALDLTCNQLKERIVNIVGGQKELYCFSQDGLSMVDGGNSGMIATNQNIEFVLRNRMPAGDSIPTFKDDVMLYGSSDGTKLYGVDFDLLINRFQVDDIAKYAKDIVNSKITELHYINNEAKLIYGLMENGQMFAINFSKGEFAGFFPLEIDGTVYDIASIKQGRDYKLLMVTNRNGHWYLEEKLDQGEYLDTDNPLLNDQDKKEATIKNLNNIALDCYNEYSKVIEAEAKIQDDKILCEEDLSSGRYMLENGEDYAIVDIKNKEQITIDNALYGWTSPAQTQGVRLFSLTHTRNESLDKDGKCAWDTNYGSRPTNWTDVEVPFPDVDSIYLYSKNQWAKFNNNMFNQRLPNRDTGGKYAWGVPSSGWTYFTTTLTPKVGDYVEYVSPTGEVSGTYPIVWTSEQVDTKPEDTVYTEKTTPVLGDNVFKGYKDLVGAVQQVSDNVITYNDRQYTRNSSKDLHDTYTGQAYNFDLVEIYGDSESYNKIYSELEYFTNIHAGLKIGVITDGRYFEYEDSENIITLPQASFKVVYGIVYSAYAFLEIQKPYESMKSIKQLAVKVQDTMHLEVGTSLDDLRAIEEINDGSFFDLSPITMNRSYVMVPSDTPEWKKYIIVKSDKGLPFTINAIECIINYSSQGGF